MTVAADISNLGVEDREHLAKGHMIEKLSPYYNQHDSSLLGRLCCFLIKGHNLTHQHHHALVDTSDYVHPDISQFS